MINIHSTITYSNLTIWSSEVASELLRLDSMDINVISHIIRLCVVTL